MEETTINLPQIVKEQKRAMRREKVEGKKRAIAKINKHNRAVITVRLVILMLMFVGGAYGFERYANWRAYHQWQFPIQWIGFVKEIEKVIISPLGDPKPEKKELTKAEIIAQSRHPKETDNIWMMESTRGTNNVDGTLQKYCEDRGETNEFGFGGMKEKICFKTFQESVDRVTQWLDDEEARAYCYYNTGKLVTDCEYVAKINTL